MIIQKTNKISNIDHQISILLSINQWKELIKISKLIHFQQNPGSKVEIVLKNY